MSHYIFKTKINRSALTPSERGMNVLYCYNYYYDYNVEKLRVLVNNMFKDLSSLSFSRNALDLRKRNIMYNYGIPNNESPSYDCMYT